MVLASDKPVLLRLLPERSLLLRRLVQPYRRCSLTEKDDALFRGARGLAIAEIKKATAAIIPKQCFPGIAERNGLRMDKGINSRGNHLHMKPPIIGRLIAPL